MFISNIAQTPLPWDLGCQCHGQTLHSYYCLVTELNNKDCLFIIVLNKDTQLCVLTEQVIVHGFAV